jgi:AbrB family looped-hinge helix DNA binding protein
MDAKTRSAKKTEIAEQMFTRPEGATMQEVIAATGGPQYNKLKQLEGLGYAVRKVKDGDKTRYFARAPEAAKFVATMTDKGQITIPRQVREQMRLRSGHKVEFMVEDDSRAVMRPAATRLADLAGILPKPKRTVSIEEMNKAIRDAAVARYLRAVGDKKR